MDSTIEHLTHDTFADAVSDGLTVIDGAIAAHAGLSPAEPLVELNTTRRWPLERVLFALAGTVTLLSALLAAVISPWFLLLTAFVGINQWLYVVVGACPASVVLRRTCRLRSAIYENGGSSPVNGEAVEIR
jgi:hypothetical protein